MTTQSTLPSLSTPRLDPYGWAKRGLLAAVAATAAVLVVQSLALALWPEIAQFKPLDSYVRSALFVLVPALGATAVLAWLVQRADRPVAKFLRLAGVVLLVSFIPDYVLPDPSRTLLASTVAALLHVVAAAVITLILVGGLSRPRSR